MSHASHQLADPELQLRLGQLRSRALVVGILGLLLCLGGWALWPNHFMPSYLVGYVFWAGLALGSLGLTMLHHLVGGSWGLVVRRPLESAAMTILPLALLFGPLALDLSQLYPWARPELVSHDRMLQHKSLYLNPGFYLVRTAVYFVVWGALALLLGRLSDAQDRRADHAPSRRLQAISGPGLVALFLTGSFAAIDWMMSLEPHWTSTIYGAMVITGEALATLAAMIVIVVFLARDPPVSHAATSDRLHDLGNLMLAFTMLWAYMAFAQFLVIWCGNLPEEIPWYLRRARGPWQWIALALLLFHFFLPFFVLLFREAKRHKTLLVRVAVLVLVMHWVDLIWLVIPASADPAKPSVPWGELPLSLAATIGIGGVWLYFFVGRLQQRPLLPVNDANLAALMEHLGA